MTPPPIFVIGGVNIDLLVGPQAPWPTPGTEVIVDHSDLRVGGGGGNTALALQALGVPTVLVAGVGRDAFGPWLRERFNGVTCDWHDSPCPTGLCIGITHPDGERTFITHLGHLADDPAAHVQAALDLAAPGAMALFTAGFLMPQWMAEYTQLIAHAKQRGLRVALDTGWPPPGWTPQVRRDVLSWLPHTDLLLLNEVEVTSLAQADSVEAAILALRPHLPRDATLVVKRGPHGVTALSNGELINVGAPAVRVIDTIGAGDTFNAAFLAAQRAGHSLHESLRAAVAYASHAVSTSPRLYAATLLVPH